MASPPTLITFTNAKLILPGHAVPTPGSLTCCKKTGLIVSIDVESSSTGLGQNSISANRKKVDCNGQILAPGFLDLQTNGMAGVHFTSLCNPDDESSEGDVLRLTKCAKLLPSSGTTAFWATIPTVSQQRWRAILPVLRPREFTSKTTDTPTVDLNLETVSSIERLSLSDAPIGADLLGGHCEGPYLAPEKKGAHAAEFMLIPASVSSGHESAPIPPQEPCQPESTNKSSNSQVHYESLYGQSNLSQVIKMITIAPEFPNTVAMIKSIRQKYPHIRIATGHTTATYNEARTAANAGATMITHAFNAMNGWTGRDPGVVGLMLDSSRDQESGKVYYSTIADGVHLHPTTLKLAIRSGLDADGLGGGRCLGITDAIELAGLADGVYEGNGQIVGRQVKKGNKVVKEGTDTLIGSCVLLDAVVREMVKSAPVPSDCDDQGEETRGRKLVIAVKAVSQNVADMMGEDQRGRLEVGRRADMVVLGWDSSEAEDVVVRQTWIRGWKVFDRSTVGDVGADSGSAPAAVEG